jgi:LysR family transcriptional regulator, transcriptional activator of nhaA
MEWLNYHHLLYFWMVAKEGSIAKASEELRLAQPTISGQIRELEDALGEKLFNRVGRGLVLTDMGRVVYRYAEDIFALGRELLDTVKDRPSGRPVRLQVGIANVVPKHIAHRILEPALRMSQKVRVNVHEDTSEQLLALLATHSLDLVISDAPIGNVKVKAYSHLLGESPVTFFAAPQMAKKYRKKFPESLNGADLLLPGENTAVRRSLDTWFESQNLRPAIVGEFDDSALMTTFGQNGDGVFPAATALEKEVQRQFGVQVVGRTDAVRERYFAISPERKLKHPAVIAITETARAGLFA